MNPQKKRIIAILSFCGIFIMITVTASSQSSSNFKIKRDVLNQGGTPATSTNFKQKDAIGQPATVGVLSSTNYSLFSGFLLVLFITSGVEDIIEKTEAPENFSLHQNYPNPFNPSTEISYSLPKSGFVLLIIYDILGNEIQTLENEFQDAGTYSVDFNAGALSSGIYFYRIRAGEFVDTKKFILQK